MNQEYKEIIAGILLIALLIGILFFVHSRSVLKKETGTFTLYAHFSKSDGLMNGAEVRVAGLPIGYVAGQELDGQYGVRVMLSFPKPVSLSADSSVSIETDGLLGEKHLEIMPGGDEEMLNNGDVISYTQDALLIDELLEKVNEYMRQKKGKELKDEKKSD